MKTSSFHETCLARTGSAASFLMTFMWVLILALNCSSIMNSNKDEECETILDDRNEHSWSYKVAGGNGERKLFLKHLASTFEEKPWLKRGKKDDKLISYETKNGFSCHSVKVLDQTVEFQCTAHIPISCTLGKIYPTDGQLGCEYHLLAWLTCRCRLHFYAGMHQKCSRNAYASALLEL